MNKCAFDNGDKCNAMTEKKCLGCKFRKTEEELKAGREKSLARLETFPLAWKMHIKRKYHL